MTSAMLPAQALLTITEQDEPPLRFLAGADAIEQAEQQVAKFRGEIVSPM